MHKETIKEVIKNVTISDDDKTVTLEIEETTKADHIFSYMEKATFAFKNVTNSTISISVKEGNDWGTNSTVVNNSQFTFDIKGGTHTQEYAHGSNERTIIRTIQRGALEQDITLKKVQRLINPEDTTPSSYTESNKFYLFEDEKQKFFISQSYSKNYPLRVNVVFEQLA